MEETLVTLQKYLLLLITAAGMVLVLVSMKRPLSPMFSVVEMVIAWRTGWATGKLAAKAAVKEWRKKWPGQERSVRKEHYGRQKQSGDCRNGIGGESNPAVAMAGTEPRNGRKMDARTV